jgi:hypothetical protein
MNPQYKGKGLTPSKQMGPIPFGEIVESVVHLWGRGIGESEDVGRGTHG